MKVGDLVEKSGGYDAGTIGVVTEIYTNPAGNKLVHVLTDGVIKVYSGNRLHIVQKNDQHSVKVLATVV